MFLEDNKLWLYQYITIDENDQVIAVNSNDTILQLDLHIFQENYCTIDIKEGRN
jgi:hypothetical protein